MKRALLWTAGFFLVFAFAHHAAAALFPRNLKLGDSGADVLLLQKELNRDPDTRLALSGPGSPGEETEYFGRLTKSAVERFQKKYTRDVLAPLGLTAPTGFVGPLTRKKLASLAASDKPIPSVQENNPPMSNPPASNPPANNPLASSSPASSSPTSASSSNPNLVNIGFYLEKVAELERANGVDEATIREHARIIWDYAASTTTDFRAQFEAELKKNLINPQSGLRKLLGSFFGWFVKLAQAQTGVPFGGPIVYTFPCTCSSGVFSLAIGPPSTASVLNYAVGTQAFLSYNLPYARFLLGLYTPGVQSCWMYGGVSCFPIPAAGQIQPIVGSSPG